MGALVLVAALLAGVAVPRGRAHLPAARAAHPTQLSAASLHSGVVRPSGHVSRQQGTTPGADVAPPAFASLAPLPARARVTPARAPLATAADGSAPTYDATAPPARLRPRFTQL